MTITISRAHRWRRRAARLGTGMGVLAVAAAALAVPSQLPPPEAQFLDVPAVHLDAGVTQLVCPSSPQLATTTRAGEVSYDTELDTGADTMEASAHFVAVTPWQGPAEIGELGKETPHAGPVAEVSSSSGPVVARYPPVEGEAPTVAGLRIGSTADGDLRGMVAGGCASPSASTWLIGGNTEVGSSTQLVLTNPGETAARVTIRGWTGLGQIAGEVVELVEPNGSTVVLTEAMQRAERVAFHVSAEGGQVAAHLTTTTLDGIVPGGVSYVMPAAAPGLETAIGPLHLEPFDNEERATALRIVNPGTEPADVSVSVLGPDGEEPLGGAEDLTLDPGVVTDVPVASPEAGQYTLLVRSSAPVAGGARTSVAGERETDSGGIPADFSWLPSGNPTDAATLLVREGAAVSITNPAPQEVALTVEGIGDDGTVTSEAPLLLEGLHTREIEIPPDAQAVRIAGAYVFASAQYHVDVDDGRLIAAVPAAWAGRTSTDVRVVVTN